MELTILGTSCQVPTKERNPSAVFLSYKKYGILIDCAEGTQRQMNIAGISRSKVTHILISHWHGDHIAGLIGLMQTIGSLESKDGEPYKIELFGPKGTKTYVKHLLKSCYFDVKINLKIHEVIPKKVDKVFENEDFEIYCCQLDHSTPCVGYSFVEKDRRNIDVEYLRKHKIKDGPHLEKLKQGQNIVFEGKKIKAKDATYVVKGKKVSYIIDTLYTTNAIKLAKYADVLIADSTFQSSLREKAEKTKHLTSEDAANIASNAEVKQLILTHFSQRYKEVSELLNEAQIIFPNTKAAFDFMKITL